MKVHANDYDEYGPFGEVVRASGAMAGVNPFQFSTKYTDAETGLNYYGYRYYNPSTGRWLSRDPLEEQGGANLYGFVGNNPLDRFDPYGQSWLEVIGLFGNWVTGTGSTYQVFQPGSDPVADMKGAPGVDKARAYFRKKNQGKCCGDLQALTNYDASFGLTGLIQAGGNSTVSV